ncbi:MAG: hypothetical protein ACON4N_16020 [Myxococcota bacterium]
MAEPMVDRMTASSAETQAPASAATGSLTDPLINPLADPLSGGQEAASAPADPGGTRSVKAASMLFNVPTWDNEAYDPRTGKSGMWVDAAPDAEDERAMRADKKGRAADSRQVKGVAALSPKKKAKVDSKLNGGRLTAEQAAGLPPEVASQINPLSNVPRTILKSAFKENWNAAKHTLVGKGTGPEMVMTKLWEFRQWHHDAILHRTKKVMDKEDGTDAFKKWAMAGSTTLTSDIDINMKGDNTEKAVAVFNRLFKEDGFMYEAGIVYDVNVYAQDFMQGATFGGLEDREGRRIAGKEGAREGMDAGGFDEASMAGQAAKNIDTRNQETWSLVKIRLYMTEAEWAAHKQSVDPDGNQAGKFLDVESRYSDYRKALFKQMGVTERELDSVAMAEKTASEQIAAAAKVAGDKGRGVPAGADPDAHADNTLMEAQNRVYEEKLRVIHKKRASLNKKIDTYNAAVKSERNSVAEVIDAEISVDLKDLRQLVSEAALYSNEAYITDGAVNHVVVGLQAGQAIQQSKAESYHSAMENAADVLKEFARHAEDVGEALYKGGKYLWRLADAARNMGAYDVDYVTEFYELGYTLANNIKKQPGSLADKFTASFKEAKKVIGLNNPGPTGTQAILMITRTLTKNLSKWYKTNVEDAGKGAELGAAVSKAKTT